MPLYSGLGLRIAVLIAFELLAILYIMHYARKVKADPTKSVMYGVETDFVQRKSLEELTGSKMDTRQKISLVLFLGTLGGLLWGITQAGWGINEIAAMFLMMMIFVGIVSGYSATDICKTFIESTKSMVSSMLIVGFTRGILLVMKDGMISDTIVYYLVSLLSEASKFVSAYGMLFLQNIIKFFITGSSSQATITMPIMAPTAELIRTEQADRRAGIPVWKRFCRDVLADFLRSGMRTDGKCRSTSGISLLRLCLEWCLC